MSQASISGVLNAVLVIIMMAAGALMGARG
jgi:hypothetical protein